MLCAVNFVPRNCPSCGTPAPCWSNGDRMTDSEFKEGNLASCPKCVVVMLFVDGGELDRVCEMAQQNPKGGVP